MSKITALRVGRRPKKRVNISLDGHFAFSLEAEVTLKENLQVGQELSTRRIEALTGFDRCHRCLNTAAHYLSYRPRSEFELRKQLHQRGFDDGTVAAVLDKLKEQGLVDDIAFAQFWKDNRESFSPRSQRLTKLELRQKGVAGNIIDQIADTIDDEDSAYRAARSKARSLPLADYQSFRRRLGNCLKRRGFSYEVINHTIARLWPEIESGLR